MDVTSEQVNRTVASFLDCAAPKRLEMHFHYELVTKALLMWRCFILEENVY